MALRGIELGIRDPFLPGDSFERDPAVGDPGGGSGGGRGLPAVSSPRGGTVVPRKVKPLPHSVFNNRRGLLLNVEQLAGPAAPNYLLRAPYVYGRQSLL